MSKNKRSPLGILHNIRSAYNTASMFRTADGAGVSFLYLAGYTPTPFNKIGRVRREFEKVALGAHEYVDWESFKNIHELIDRLHADDFFIFAVEQDPSSISLRDLQDYVTGEEKVAFILGNEVDGVPRDVLEKVDKIVEIPMYGKKQSLNVSVAFGVVAYELALRS